MRHSHPPCLNRSTSPRLNPPPPSFTQRVHLALLKTHLPSLLINTKNIGVCMTGLCSVTCWLCICNCDVCVKVWSHQDSVTCEVLISRAWVCSASKFPFREKQGPKVKSSWRKQLGRKNAWLLNALLRHFFSFTGLITADTDMFDCLTCRHSVDWSVCWWHCFQNTHGCYRDVLLLLFIITQHWHFNIPSPFATNPITGIICI